MGKYMIATKAIHSMGDISRDEEDLCFINDETETDYIGNWITGFGFIRVKFPKDSTRELTDAEIEKYNKQWYQLASQPPQRMHIERGLNA